jgi:hypothetical protein
VRVCSEGLESIAKLLLESPKVDSEHINGKTEVSTKMMEGCMPFNKSYLCRQGRPH